MKNVKLKLAVLGAFSMLSAQAMATGFVNLPDTGFAVSGGTSAYTVCNGTGNFGSTDPVPPTLSANNTCAIFIANEGTAPLAGFSKIASATRPIVVNNSYTNNTNVTIGQVKDEVWRNAAGTECIYGAKITETLYVDWNLTVAGVQGFEINDFARAGFSGRPVDVAYYATNNVDDVVFRAGRAFTSVQHKADAVNPALPAAGTLAQPLTASAPPLGTAINTDQAAAISTNWVDFTMDVNWADTDGGFNKANKSSMMYVKSTCSSAAPVAVAGALRFRQTGQEIAPLVEISVTGYAPPGANTNP
jgi:hypothetical protein